MYNPLSRRQLLRASGITALIAVSGCKKSASNVTLTVGDQKGGLQSLLQRSGEISNLPYKIKWAQFAAAAPLFEALNAGAIDAGIGGDAPFVFFLASNPPAQAIAALTYTKISQNQAGILVRADSPFQSIHDLVGKRVAVVRGSTGQYITLAALQSAGLPLDSVHFAFLQPSDSLTTLLSKGLDGWGSWEPYMSLGELHYGLRPLALNVQQLGGVGFIVATNAAITGKADALHDVLARLSRARTWAAANQAAYAAGFAKDTGLPLDVAQRYVSELSYKIAPIDTESVATVHGLANLYTAAKLLPKSISVNAGFDLDFFAQT